MNRSGPAPRSATDDTGARADAALAELRGLRCQFLDARDPALEGVDLRVGPGEIVAVMGHTGAGKSTLLKCLTGIVPTFEPATVTGVRVAFGEPLASLRPGDLAGRVGIVFQDFEAQLFSTNVALEVGFGLEQLGLPRDEIRRRTAAALAVVGLSGFESRDPATLSGGEKQRLAMAAVWATAPRLVLLDEPTTDIDPLGKAAIFELLRAFRDGGAGVVVVEHETRAAEVADRLVLLSDGRVHASGPAAELRVQAPLLEACGVRPRDLDVLAAALDLDTAPRDVDHAELLLRERGLVPSEARLPHDDGESATSGGDRRPLLEVENVRHVYPEGAMALDGVSLQIAPGEFIAMIGQNGSGKTTLAKHLNGLLHPTGGSVRLRGVDTRNLSLGQIAGTIGFVFQDPDAQIFSASVRDEIAFGPIHLHLEAAELEARVERCLAISGLTARQNDDPFWLSKGERQRLAVASVLALEPRVFILDEPTTGLDHRERRAMLDLLASLHREGRTVIVITHAPWVVAEYASRAILLARGRVLFDGPVRRLLREQELLAQASFALPDATALGMRFGVPVRSVAELVQAIGAGRSEVQ